ncbi:uncharacterized protein LOC114463975 isoform X5 [Gouania willdenowi]|uniref:uncharacterized protein LOC114463975 isoform X5 n=1 Tax=Gouania willdenowi TaxID=441366 RepID=UPI0010560833|nr:uncharacterized protein LOC114463975 isoform X5 [Gouania willdenowi]
MTQQNQEAKQTDREPEEKLEIKALFQTKRIPANVLCDVPDGVSCKHGLKLQDHLHIKKEEEELWESLEEKQETDITAVTVKSEDEEEEDQCSLLHWRQRRNIKREPTTCSSAKLMKVEPNGDISEGPEAANTCTQQDTDGEETDCSDTEDSEDWREPLSQSEAQSEHMDMSCENFQTSENNTRGTSHNTHKPFCCELCGKRFGRKEHLTVHTRIHTGEKPFSCDVCGKRFCTRTHLKIHMRIHTEEKCFSCDVCGKRFSARTHLENHMRCHTGEKPFSCDVCGKRFSDRTNLKVHTRVHTGEKPFGCDVCWKRFSNRTNFNNHTKIHTREKPYGCDFRQKRFIIKREVINHTTIHTEDSEDEDVEEKQIENTEDETEEPAEKTVEMRIDTGKKKKAKSGAAIYRCAFKREWTAEWPFITVGTTSSYFWCSICRHENSCAHQGKADVTRHIKSKAHRTKEQAIQSTASIAPCHGPDTVDGMTAQEVKTRRAEVKVAVSMVEHNVPFAVADHFSPLLKECFKDSPTAQSFKSACTKMSCIINGAVAPHFRKELVMKMRTNPFTLITDESNDTGREKMNLLTVRVYDNDLSKVVHRFLDMCSTSRPNCGTAEMIYKKMDEALQKNAIPWRNCVSLSVDNARVNTGDKNSIASRIHQEHASIYIHGCPCHIIHNTAKQAGQAFLEVCGFDPEDLAVDVGYWFKGNTNRQGYLTEFCELHGSDYMEMLMHVSVRWLSLEKCLTRILQQYAPLASYLKSLDDKQPRFRRLVEAFSDPITEVYLLFYQAMFQVFSTFNLLLQREKSSIFLLHDEMRGFIHKLLSKFLKPAALQHRELHEICFKEPSNQLPGEKLVIGFTTRATLNRLLEAGDVTLQQVQRFQQAAVAFLERAVEYAIKKLPMKEPLIKHAMFLDVQQRAECGVEDAFYFVDRFPELLPYNGPEERDKLIEEFLDYQSMDITMPEDPAMFDFESFWGNMASMNNKVTGISRFGRLSRIAKLVLVLPHSNADAERLFSVVGLNKTKIRNSLALEGTLSSIMTVKMASLEPQCFKWEPPVSVIKASKSATNTYNMRNVPS